MKALEIKNVSRHFGGLTAVSGVSLDLEVGELVGLIGPNGAGKTTLFNMLTGIHPANEGEVVLHRDDTVFTIVNQNTHRIANLGITRTFQNIRLFKKLTALDNVKIAMHKSCDYSILAAFLRTPKYYQREEEIENKSLELLSEMGLANKAEILAENLPYGEQRKLEIARALATKPQILFLDEPAAGMNPQETMDLTNLIRMIKDKFGLTILLIEHDMSLVMNVCERIYVLDYGSIIAEGKPEEIKSNPRVIEAYLGGDI